MKRVALVFSCEHAVNTVPKEYLSLFAPYNTLLVTHRGYDMGALSLAEYLQQQFAAPLVSTKATRLLIDCNRSLKSRDCFSEITCNVSEEQKQRIIDQYYLPYRQEVLAHIHHCIEKGFLVWHFSIHSFTPIFHGVVRNAHLGLLYDPRRLTEKNLARRLAVKIKESAHREPSLQLPQPLRMRMNYPYKGISDGFTSALRKCFSDENYVGIEIEVNQAITQDTQPFQIIKEWMALALMEVIGN